MSNDHQPDVADYLTKREAINDWIGDEPPTGRWATGVVAGLAIAFILVAVGYIFDVLGYTVPVAAVSFPYALAYGVLHPFRSGRHRDWEDRRRRGWEALHTLADRRRDAHDAWINELTQEHRAEAQAEREAKAREEDEERRRADANLDAILDGRA